MPTFFALRQTFTVLSDFKVVDLELFRRSALFTTAERFVASLQLKNERGKRLTSHRSDHVTGVWGGLHDFCNVQRILPHLGV